MILKTMTLRHGRPDSLFRNSFTVTQHELAAVLMKVMMNACHKQLCLYKNEFGSLSRSVFSSLFAYISRISSKTEGHVTVPLTVLKLSTALSALQWLEVCTKNRTHNQPTDERTI
jgi:hypothetical protein